MHILIKGAFNVLPDSPSAQNNPHEHSRLQWVLSNDYIEMVIKSNITLQHCCKEDRKLMLQKIVNPVI